jgi:hypothetical protein
MRKLIVAALSTLATASEVV